MCPPPNTANHSHFQECGDLLQDCRHICTKPPKNCVVMTSKGFYETCGCPEEKTTAGGGSGYVYVGGSWAQSTGIKRVTYTGANAKTTVGGGSENAKMTTVGGGSQDVDERKVVDEDTGCVFETKAVVYALAILSTALLG